MEMKMISFKDICESLDDASSNFEAGNKANRRVLYNNLRHINVTARNLMQLLNDTKDTAALVKNGKLESELFRAAQKLEDLRAILDLDNRSIAS